MPASPTATLRRLRRPVRFLTSTGTAGAVLATGALAATAPDPRSPARPGPDATSPEGTLAAVTSVRPDVRALPIPREGGRRAAISVTRTRTFSMLGITWRNPRAGSEVEVKVRTRDDAGWSGWEHMHVEATPAPEETDSVRGGTEPLWVGPSHGVQVRVEAPGRPPAGLELALIDPGEGRPGIALQNAPLSPMPRVIRRARWGADESLRDHCSSPRYGTTVRGVTVHHTVNTNDYTRADTWAIVRGIYAYHTRSQNWCDLGYNFLVDRFGRTWEGRAGGITRQVRGAHAGDFDVNRLATGVALIGNFEHARPRRAMRRALVALTAWRLEAFYRNPRGSTTIGGRRLPVVMGHRDVVPTACPGHHVHAWLPTLRAEAARARGEWRTSIYRVWQRRGGESGWIGSPRIGEEAYAGGRRTRFTHADLYWHPDIGVRYVRGPIRRRYDRLGAATSVLGFPTTNEHRGTDRRLRFHHFQRGVLYHHPDTGTRVTHGPIRAKYRALGGPESDFGMLTSDVRAGAGGVPAAQLQNLQRGRIYHHPTAGTHVTHGPIAGAYYRRGAAAGMHGFPRSDVQANAGGDPDGHVQRFQRGWFFHHPATGAHEVHGAIAGAYLRHKAAGGPLGFPTTDVRTTSYGLRSDFQGGRITWTRETRTTTVTYH